MGIRSASTVFARLSKGLSFALGVSIFPASMTQVRLKGVAYLQIAGQVPTARLALAYRRGEVSPVVRKFITRAVFLMLSAWPSKMICALRSSHDARNGPKPPEQSQWVEVLWTLI
jgi:hypothetical protein